MFLPSKVYDAMASKSAIICISGGHNDVAEMVEKEHIGFQVHTGDVEQLKKTIIRLAEDEVCLKACQENARKLAVGKYAVEKVTAAYAELFKSIMEAGK